MPTWYLEADHLCSRQQRGKAPPKKKRTAPAPGKSHRQACCSCEVDRWTDSFSRTRKEIIELNWLAAAYVQFILHVQILLNVQHLWRFGIIEIYDVKVCSHLFRAAWPLSNPIPFCENVCYQHLNLLAPQLSGRVFLIISTFHDNGQGKSYMHYH
jgi:hypothetical protein